MTEATVSNPLKRGRIEIPHIPEAIHKKRRHEHKRAVDRLPSEILSHIFLMSETLARKTRARTVSYNTVQEVASQVCSYWRYWRKAEICIAEWDKQLESLGALLDYLVSQGADFRRWKSLSISSKRLEPLFVLILRLNFETASSLERITFKNHQSENTPDITLASSYRSFNHGGRFRMLIFFRIATTYPNLRSLAFVVWTLA
ncbi:hypothetical protein RSAG8_03305, partial [Rhizoctonia solani AG-8 WAC10335]